MNIYFENLQISLLLLQKSLHPTEQQHSLGCSAYSTCRTSLWVATNGFHSCICTGWVGEGGVRVGEGVNGLNEPFRLGNIQGIQRKINKTGTLDTAALERKQKNINATSII